MMMKRKITRYFMVSVLAFAGWGFVLPSLATAEGQENWPLERPAGNTDVQPMSTTFKMQLAGLVALFAGGDKDAEAEATLNRMVNTPTFTHFELQALRSQMVQIFFERQDLDRALNEAEALIAVDVRNYFLVDQAHMQMASLHFLKADSTACLKSLYNVVPYQTIYTYQYLNTLAECHYYEAEAQVAAGRDTAMGHYSDALFFAFNTLKMFGWDGGVSISGLANAQLLGPILMESAWQADTVPEAYALLEEIAATNGALDLWMFTLSAYATYTKAGVALTSALFEEALLQQLVDGKSPAEFEGYVQALIDQRFNKAQ